MTCSDTFEETVAIRSRAWATRTGPKAARAAPEGAAGFRGGRTMVVQMKLAHRRDAAPLTQANIDSTRRSQQSTVPV
jgi:hypothetical protein